MFNPLTIIWGKFEPKKTCKSLSHQNKIRISVVPLE
jgi:hypothetical protein